MLRRSEDAILILSPSRIELSRRGSSASDHVESMAYGPGVWNDAISSAFKPFDHWLGRASGALGLSKNTRVMVYLSGTRLRTEVSHHAGSERAVSGIAHATMAEQFDQQDGLYQVAVSRLEGRPEADSNTTRYFFSAETDSVLDSIVAFVEQAGFACTGVSCVALSHAKAVSKMLASQQETRLICDVGEHETIVAMGEQGAVPLFRPFSVGIASFTDVYVRVLEQAQVEDAHQRARELVFRHGVPGRDSVLDPSLNLTGRDVLPMLQPVIQRLAVEIKNTLRFGLEGHDTESLHVELTGLASRMPGLASALSINLDSEITSAADPGSDCDKQPTPPSYARSALAAGTDHNPLRPLCLSRQRARKRVNWVMRLGGHVAAGILLAEFLVTFADTRALAGELRSLEPRLAAVREFGEQSDRAAVLAAELGDVRSVIDERIEHVARWAPALNAIAGAMQENMRLIDCRGFRESGYAWYRLSGEVELESAEDRSLGVFLDRIEKNDMFDLIELESARVEDRTLGSIQRFVVRVQLVSRPAAPEAVVLAERGVHSAAQEGGPP